MYDEFERTLHSGYHAARWGHPKWVFLYVRADMKPYNITLHGSK